MVTDTASVLHSGTLQIAWRQGRADPGHQEIRTARYLQKQKPRKESEEEGVGSGVPEGLTDTQEHKVQVPADSREPAEFFSRSLRGESGFSAALPPSGSRGKLAFPGRGAFPSPEPL